MNTGKKVRQLVAQVAALNPKCAEIGAGMLANLHALATEIQAEWEQATPLKVGDKVRIRQGGSNLAGRIGTVRDVLNHGAVYGIMMPGRNTPIDFCASELDKV